MPVTYKVKTGTESLTSNSGLALIGALLAKTNLRDQLNTTILDGCKEPKISHSDMVYSMIGLLCLGKPDYAAIEPFRTDPFFSQSLGISYCPSSSSLRERIDAVEGAFDDILKRESASMVNREAPQISPIITSCGSFIPLDADVSPFDNSRTKKEGVSWTYKKVDGFAPMFAYVGQEGYLVNIDFREGKQHCQKGTPEFLLETIKYTRMMTSENLLVRLDSGNDSKDNFEIMSGQDVDFIVKRNLRKEDPFAWLKLAKEIGVQQSCRDGKQVWIGKTDHDIKGNPLPFPIVFEVTERSAMKDQQLLFTEVEVDNYWVSLDLEPEETIRLYHDHGTSEQFHSELKTDMDLERLPSSHFASNSLILTLGMLAYNMLRLCGQESLQECNENAVNMLSYRKKVKRRRIRTVMLDLIYMAGRVIHTSRQWYISFGKYNPRMSLWGSIYRKFVSV